MIVGAVVGTVYGFGFGGSPRAFGPDDPFYLDLLQFASRRLRNGALLAALTASIGGVFGALLGAIISYVVRAVRSPTTMASGKVAAPSPLWPSNVVSFTIITCCSTSLASVTGGDH